MKRLSDPKNYRNRIGEALRQHPAVVVLLRTNDTASVEDAVADRLHLSPGSTVLVCEQPSFDAEWRVSFIYSRREVADRLGSTRVFPDARLVPIEIDASLTAKLPVEQRQLLMAEIEALPLGIEEPVAVVESIVRRVTSITPRTKHIVDLKNIGNRISEGLGAGTALLVVAVTFELLDMAVANAQEQLRGLDPIHGIIIVPEDVEGCLAESPVYLGVESPEDDEINGDEVGEAGEVDEANEPDFDVRTNATAPDCTGTSFLELESPEERSQMVAEHLLFEGPLHKRDAIRLAAQRMREHGQVDYQRLRTNGKIYTAILEAVDFGVRVGDFDRPRRGEVRAVLPSPDDFSRDQWIVALLFSVPRDQPMVRETLVRCVAVWAKENLGLEYIRLRRNGRIDTGVRGAIRTLLRRDVLQAPSREELLLPTIPVEADRTPG